MLIDAFFYTVLQEEKTKKKKKQVTEATKRLVNKLLRSFETFKKESKNENLTEKLKSYLQPQDFGQDILKKIPFIFTFKNGSF